MLEQCEKRYENVSQVVDEKEHIIKKSFKKCENTSSVEMLDVFIFGNLGAILFLLLYNCLLLYLIKKIYNKENITYKNYIDSRKILLINFFKSSYSVSDVIRTAENNTSHPGKTDKGKEKEDKLPVIVKVRETNNQHPHPDENELRGLIVDLTEDDVNPKVW